LRASAVAAHQICIEQHLIVTQFKHWTSQQHEIYLYHQQKEIFNLLLYYTQQ